MRLLLDLNVLFDVAQKREPFFKFSSIIISEILKKNAWGVIPSHAVTTLYYLVEKATNKQQANEFVDWLLSKFSLAPSYKATFKKARKMDAKDFEDAVVMILAEKHQCDFIITRNLADFQNSIIPALTPEQYIIKFLLDYDFVS